MSNSVKLSFKAEMSMMREARLAGNLDLAVHHLERAHIIGQRYFFAHLITHIHMLRFAVSRGQANEVRGQLIRLLAVLPAYLVGWVPVGNPGSARVSAVKPMPVPDDLQVLFKGYSVSRQMGIRAALLGLAVLAAIGVCLHDKANDFAAVEVAGKLRKVGHLADFRKALTIPPPASRHAQYGEMGRTVSPVL